MDAGYNSSNIQVYINIYNKYIGVNSLLLPDDINIYNKYIDGTLLLLPDDRKNYTGYLLGGLGTLGTYPNSLMIGKANVRKYKHPVPVPINLVI